ncbi:MAG: hypothetical protein AAF682_32235 [Planctomycetota bacterium]
MPLQWATTQNNLGNALRSLGQREGDPARLGEAVDAFRAALQVFREGAPAYAEMASRNLERTTDLLRSLSAEVEDPPSPEVDEPA